MEGENGVRVCVEFCVDCVDCEATREACRWQRVMPGGSAVVEVGDCEGRLAMSDSRSSSSWKNACAMAWEGEGKPTAGGETTASRAEGWQCGLERLGGVRSTWSAAVSTSRIGALTSDLMSGTFIHSPSTSVRKSLHAAFS
jgi:hypothetical protein